MGLDMAAIRRRIARGANVTLNPVAAEDGENLHELLYAYASELARNHQHAEAEKVRALYNDWERRFVKIVPCKTGDDEDIEEP
jgi:glutamate synthase (NADPH/NADH) large chain